MALTPTTLSKLSPNRQQHQEHAHSGGRRGRRTCFVSSLPLNPCLTDRTWAYVERTSSPLAPWSPVITCPVALSPCSTLVLFLSFLLHTLTFTSLSHHRSLAVLSSLPLPSFLFYPSSSSRQRALFHACLILVQLLIIIYNYALVAPGSGDQLEYPPVSHTPFLILSWSVLRGSTKSAHHLLSIHSFLSCFQSCTRTSP